MKGTVVGTWIQTAKTLWGETVVQTVMEQNGWEANRLFLPLEDITINAAKEELQKVLENGTVDDIRAKTEALTDLLKLQINLSIHPIRVPK